MTTRSPASSSAAAGTEPAAGRHRDPPPMGAAGFAAILDGLADAVLVADMTGVVRVANPAAVELFGRQRDELIASPLIELMRERFRQAHTDAFTRFMATGSGSVVGGPAIPVVALRGDGSEVEVDLALSAITVGAETMAVGTLRDATAARAELNARLRVAQRSQTFLLQATEVLAHATGYVHTIERLAGIAVPTLADLCLIDVLTDNGELVRMAARHADRSRQPLADELRRSYPPQVTGTHPSAAVLATGASQWSPEMTDEFLRATTRDARHYELVTMLGFSSYISVPLIEGTQVLGVVTLVSAGSGRRFHPADLALAEELAGRVALVAAKAKRYEDEQRVSSTLQAHLLPAQIPTVAGLDVAVRYLPGTRDLEVGGDFYDVLAAGDVVIFIVGDVAGHDTVAAAVMGQLRTACRAFATQTAGPAQLLTMLQENWRQLGFEQIATAVVLHLDLHSGALRIATAGHPPPVLIDASTVGVIPVDPGPPLGIPAGVISEWAGVLPRGAAILCYTDGLIEDRHQDIDVGTAQLIAACRLAADSADELCDHILTVMTGADRGDDVALLALVRQ